ncbi:FYVE, RhoGEF and PH domain-containing protein 6-like [Melanotaenia boesemani]|uniref:FYVE, RhoGEF and PH domain-containing protein 6-like n=1 Tax=Melanotaenia boesemani TaxID=1250792 RepID=UPI001C047E26|nr:FYVE, RhoGEF and PH domain-containing protein 6-like [Melanotaenia boesemani]
MNSGTHKPPVAPKPKLALYQKPILSPQILRKDGLSHLSPGTAKKVKPALAPKPCLPKITSTVESKPKTLKSLHTPALETPRPFGLLNSQGGIQQENKKSDWDYIVPICLCSKENCTCITSSNLEKMEKDFKTAYKSKTEENRKTVPASQSILDNNRGKDAMSQMMNLASTNTNVTFNKPLHEMQTVDKKLSADFDTSSSEDTIWPCIPNRTSGNETNDNAGMQSVPGREPEDEGFNSERTSVSQCTPAPAGPRKPHPVPVPRKLVTAVLADQDKVEGVKEETTIWQERETNVKEVNMSSDGKGSSSLSVSVPESENMQSVILSTRKAFAPPAPPPRKKPFLNNTKQTPTPAPQMPTQDVQEEDLGWDSSIYEMEISVDNEDEEIQGKRGNFQEAADCDFVHHPPSNVLLSQPVPITVAAEENGMVKIAPKKPHRHISPMALVEKNESLEEKEEETADDCEIKQVSSSQDNVLKEKITRELPLPPNEKSNGNLLTSGNIKPSRSSLSKHKAKSFSSADIILSEGQRKHSFRKFLDLKLAKKMLPKMKTKGGQSQNSPENSYKESTLKGQDEDQKFSEHLSGERKLSCPLTGLEQSVDEDEFSPGLEQARLYETIRDYEEITEYVNVHVGKAGFSSTSYLSQPWQSSLYNDDGIYEEQEPYISLVKNALQSPPAEYDRSSVDEEVTVPWDDDFEANSSDEEDEDDSSSISSKDDPEQPEENMRQSEQKKSKIHHIATEIMSSESVFVDVLKLLHVDFRDSVLRASQQSGKAVIEERLLNQILYYLPQLYELNQDLLRELQQRVAKWDDNSQLADIFLEKGPYLKMYSTYIHEFDKNVALLEEQTKKNPAFGTVVKEFEASPRCANLALKHYLLKPVQRIPQYQLLLTDYLKNLSQDSNDYKDTQAALLLVKEVANHANDIMKQGDNFQKLIQVQCRLSGHHEIVQPGRIFLKEGVLMKLSRKVMQPRMFFLFNDTLLYTTPVQSGQYKLKNMLLLAGMKVSKPSQEAYQNELNIESVERSFILSASSAAERDEWLEAISRAISDYTKKKISFISSNPPDEVKLREGGDGAPLGSKAPIWIPDPRTTMCMICTCEFTLTWRRHHCRACGKVVCQSCSSNKHQLEYLKNQLARVCDQCFLVLQLQKNEIASVATLSPGHKASFAFNRKQKKIPAALKEVTANTDNSSMSGYLQRSKRNKKQGKRLWFVIKDKVLYTYAASEDVAALESQPLLGFVLKFDSLEKMQFKLYHKHILYYNFKADDVQTTQRWINSFREATVL